MENEFIFTIINELIVTALVGILSQSLTLGIISGLIVHKLTGKIKN